MTDWELFSLLVLSKVFIWKTCVISSFTALHFIYVLILCEISKNSTFNQSKVFLDRSKYLTNPFRSLWMTWSILNSYSIDQKEHPIDQKEFSINQKFEEIHHEVSRWLNWFSNPVWLIDRNIRSIERNSQLVETRETECFQIFLVTIFDVSIE